MSREMEAIQYVELGFLSLKKREQRRDISTVCCYLIRRYKGHAVRP